MKASNIYSSIPHDLAAEHFATILQTDFFKLERIVSRGHATAAGHWYDQDHDEWVIVLTGRARLRIEGEAELVELAPGDHVLLPAHRRHRVEWTEPETETLWLALHYRPSATPE